VTTENRPTQPSAVNSVRSYADCVFVMLNVNDDDGKENNW